VPANRLIDKKDIKISKKKTFRILKFDFFMIPPGLIKNSKLKKIVKIKIETNLAFLFIKS